MGKIIVIGIAGGTGSGTTTITRKLVEHFGDQVTVIYHDNYYRAHHDMPPEEREKRLSKWKDAVSRCLGWEKE